MTVSLWAKYCLRQGEYTIKSDSLGIIKLVDSKIRSLRAKSICYEAGKDSESGSGCEERSIQEKMTNNKEIMSLI
jgi:hypothetical protein